MFKYNFCHAKATTLGNGWWWWQRWWPTEMATAMADGDGDSNGQRQGQWWWQWLMATQQEQRRQWATATATAMADGNGDRNRQWQRQRGWRRNGERDGNGNNNGNGHGNGNNDKGRVASHVPAICSILPPPPWTQRSVHSPALHHGGDIAKSVCSLSRGRVPDSSPWVFFLIWKTTVQFTKQPSVHPLHYSGIQEPCQPIDILPPPLLFHIFAKVSLGEAFIVCLWHAALWQGWHQCKEVPKSPPPLTQKRVHCPVLSHGRCHCKELSPPFRGRDPDSTRRIGMF